MLDNERHIRNIDAEKDKIRWTFKHYPGAILIIINTEKTFSISFVVHVKHFHGFSVNHNIVLIYQCYVHSDVFGCFAAFGFVFLHLPIICYLKCARHDMGM